MMTGGSVITESLGLDKDARQAEICAKSKADILSFPLFLTSQQSQVLSPEYVANITVTNIYGSLKVRPCPHNGSMPVAKPIGSDEGALDHFLWSSSVLFPWLCARSLAGSLLPIAVSTLLSAVSLKSCKSGKSTDVKWAENRW